MRIIRATHLGMCFGVRDAIALALASAEAGPLTILGDLVHNPTVLSALEARGIAVANDVAQVTTHTLMVNRARCVGAGPRQHPGARLARRGGDVSARARGPSGGDGTRARWVSRGDHRAARSCGGARVDRRSRRLRRGARRGGRAGARGAPTHRHRRADDAVNREGAASGRVDPGGGSRARTSASSTRCASRPRSDRTRRSSWRAHPTS